MTKRDVKETADGKGEGVNLPTPRKAKHVVCFTVLFIFHALIPLREKAMWVY
jgi:hypothetical protein